ncbi:hypothetical protein LCM08_23880 [Salipiger pacificus]|nr:hypothetical protein [Alloyangia pacifica]
MGQQGATDEVHVGRDGFLFLAGGNHGVFSYFTGKSDPELGSAQTFRENLESRASYCAEHDLLFRTVIFPEKCFALSSETGIEDHFESLYQRCYASEVGKSPAAGMVKYPVEKLRENSDAFSRTDTHYAAWGNLYIVQQLLMDIFPDHVSAGIDRIAELISDKPNFSGDLGRKFTPEKTETCSVVKGRAVPFSMAANGLKGGNDGICVLVSSPQAISDKTLLIYGDSFFRQMLPMLAVFYRKVIFCRTRFFHYEMVSAFRPDHVFCGLAERYLSRCSADSKRPHFLSYPIVLGREMTPDAEFSELWQEFVHRQRLL